jgi:nitrite reductase (NO-forming)
MNAKRILCVAAAAVALMAAQTAQSLAETVKVELPVIEKELPVDNAGNTQQMWTFGGTVPGPTIRVTQGDTIDFTLVNQEGNKQSHSMDFHAAIVSAADEFEAVKPGQNKQFTFEANKPGVFIYHCGADPMIEHIGRGMYGVIIVDPKEGYSEAFPKPDREYILVHGDLFEAGTTAKEMIRNENRKGTLVNGRMFHYDPLHDPNAGMMLMAKPGERVRIYFVNAQVNEPVSFHPIANIWDKVWNSGNPKNVEHDLQTRIVPVASGAIFDIIPPKGRESVNVLVDHAMKHALTGGISVLMNSEAADDSLGHGDNLLPRP